MTIPFDECASLFLDNQTNLELYSWHGPVRIGDPNSSYITVAGCNALCGSGPHWKDWDKSSITITTWVLPIMGLLLGAAFEPNQFRWTMMALVRWVGSPIMSLTVVLWNIKLTGKCSMLLDLTTAYEEMPPKGSPFASMRDSLGILTIMNQFFISPDITAADAVNVERLIRVALFAHIEVPDPRSPHLNTDTDTLRAQLATAILIRRRRGVIPNVLTYLWFIFALVISIQFSFSNVGDSEIAMDLALGLVLSWIPILILCSIIDRNPVCAEDIRFKINRYIHHIRCALLQQQHKRELSASLLLDEDFYDWIDPDSQEPQYMGNILGDFAGQARFHWQHGLSPSIVAGIEDHVGIVGRGWLTESLATRRALLCESSPKGIFWVDPFGIWQILLASTYVAGTAAGAFWIAYWTPTVGLGCHALGYLVFVMLSFMLFFLEITCWWLLPRNSNSRRWGSAITTTAESINSSWLLFITTAQTFGLYEACTCIGGAFDPYGGYIDFSHVSGTLSSQVYSYWLSGTLFACAVLTWGTGFVVMKWCEQSHLTTLEYDSAVRGLMWTRHFTNATRFVRWAPEIGVRILSKIFNWALKNPDRKPGMLWTRNVGTMFRDSLGSVSYNKSGNWGDSRRRSIATTKVGGSKSASNMQLQVLVEEVSSMASQNDEGRRSRDDEVRRSRD